jgi:hypothetical protein
MAIKSRADRSLSAMVPLLDAPSYGVVLDH